MNSDELTYLQELKNDDSASEFVDETYGVIRLKTIYRGEGLYFQLNDRALICTISARDAMLSKKSIKRWDNGKLIEEQERDTILEIIKCYYPKAYLSELTVI
ncbi:MULTISPECIES: hypothetical protein [Kosakonia]|uniref:hypothetical protein n=1 Tax=Kosakonia TaxID=1330547 RepID=UPI00201E410A|nr:MULTISPECIES: hypothetical protein [Kosakonia]MCL6745341.1 hypothetical protein [Kosakonia sp. R1.Fl]MDZ7320497.1 hypothetical protein [Kosakonia sacchari]